jgi:hypothetical protein
MVSQNILLAEVKEYSDFRNIIEFLKLDEKNRNSENLNKY